MRNNLARFCVVCLALDAVAAEPALVRVLTKKAQSHFGELISSDAKEVKLFDLARNAEVTMPKAEVLSLTSPVAPEEATRTSPTQQSCFPACRRIDRSVMSFFWTVRTDTEPSRRST